MNARTCMTEQQRTDIVAKVAEVEAKTAAEVVCAVATESGRYDRAESIVGIIFSMLALFALFFVFAIIYEHFENLWVPILAHAGNNLIALLAVLAELEL